MPIDQISVNNRKVVALAVSHDVNALDKTLSMDSFDGKAFSCIVDKEGALVVKPRHEALLQLGYNVVSTLSITEIEEGSSRQLKKNLKDNKGGQILFTQSDVRYYLVYTPIDTEGWSLCTFVPASVVNGKSDMMLNMTLVLCGFLTLVFLGVMAYLIYNFYANKRRLEHIAYVDELTGGHTIQKFYDLAEAALATPKHPQYALVYTNLEKFKMVNEQFGREVGDAILKIFQDNVTSYWIDVVCMGRIAADNFCALIKYKHEASFVDGVENWYVQGVGRIRREEATWPIPVVEFGVYVIEEDIPFTLMIDRAKLALRENSKGINNKLKYAIYNAETGERLMREKELEDAMENALAQGEFQVYLQPKHLVSDEKIGGAEALVRWVRPTEGMIGPGEFIPLFEKNGFIVEIDLWVFEEVCRHLRLWIDEDFDPVKISVNCSRIHLKNPNFLDEYTEIAKKYQIPDDLIEIELTESIVMENAEELSQVIERIHTIGFGCSMDDFRSGYSSLNLIVAIPVDTLKLDKVFFADREECKSSRMKAVLESIVTMAKALSMVTVAEGVEYPEQVDLLKQIGCDYIQGFVFSKPMPMNEFEKLAFGIELQKEKNDEGTGIVQ